MHGYSAGRPARFSSAWLFTTWERYCRGSTGARNKLHSVCRSSADDAMKATAVGPAERLLRVSSVSHADDGRMYQPFHGSSHPKMHSCLCQNLQKQYKLLTSGKVIGYCWEPVAPVVRQGHLFTEAKCICRVLRNHFCDCIKQGWTIM